ncbi:MAG: hypothetical protein HYZ75_13815 [Elusimicrobia bacterium]|nr:hypothetical protein [Elusimicrobiota bacterium]
MVGEAGVGGAGTAGASARVTGQTFTPGAGYGGYNGGLSVSGIVNPNTPTAVGTGGAPRAVAAAADPRTSLPPSAASVGAPSPSAFVGQGAPETRPSAAQAGAGSMVPGGTLPPPGDARADNPAGGMSTIGGAMKGLDNAKKDERAGQSGAVGGHLDKLFDFSRGRAGDSALPTDSPSAAHNAGAYGTAVQGLPDPKVVGVAPALAKVQSLARGAEHADAPALYGRAVDIAREGLPEREAAARVAGLKKEAAVRAPAAVKDLTEKALSAAAAGRTSDAARFAKSVHGWDELLRAPGQPYVENVGDVARTVQHVLTNALEKPGRAAPAPKIRVEQVRASGGRPAFVRVKFKHANASDAPMPVVPQSLASMLALPELKGFMALDGPLELEGSGMASDFNMRSSAGVLSSARAAMAQGGSLWSGFWVAARALGGSVLSLWDELRAFLIRALQSLGILRAALPAGPEVEAPSAQVLAELRALPAERAERPAPAASGLDALGLGYRVVLAR